MPLKELIQYGAIPMLLATMAGMIIFLIYTFCQCIHEARAEKKQRIHIARQIFKEVLNDVISVLTQRHKKKVKRVKKKTSSELFDQYIDEYEVGEKIAKYSKSTY